MVVQRQLRISAVAESLPDVMAFFHDFWSTTALPDASAFPFELAVEELFLNVASHGATAAARAPEVVITLQYDGADAVLTIEDDGRAFDPLSLPEPDTAAAVPDRAVGGLGVFLVRKLMDTVTYEHTGTHNRLSLRKVIP